MYKIIAVLGILCSLLLGSCGRKLHYDYKVALDAQWFSLNIPGRSTSLTAFTTELIEACATLEKLKIGIFQKSWSNLMLGMQEGHYQAICTSMQPYLFYEKLYVFSDIYLKTGPVIVVEKNSTIQSLEQLADMEMGILRGSSYALILEKYPQIIQRTYDSIPSMLYDLTKGKVDGALLDNLTAQSFVQDLFQSQLKISSDPLTQEGLRLIGIRGKSEELIRRFNRSLSKLKSNGVYSKIAQKWRLKEDKTDS